MGKKRWNIEEYAFIGLFSFSQFVMWNDLRNRSEEISQNKVVSTVKCGNPAAWYNRNPDNYSDTKQLTHTLSAKMKLPGRAGRYKLAFYLKNSLNRYARVSIDAAVVNGYHILHEFDVA